MMREQWPQARITSIAPYGTDHASRQQGMQQLLAHQGELHQVADGPARPAPVRAPLPQPGREVTRLKRPLEVEALSLLAAELSELLPRLPRLDSLCHHVQAQPAAQLCGRTHDHRVGLALSHREHERAVYLQGVNREAV